MNNSVNKFIWINEALWIFFYSSVIQSKASFCSSCYFSARIFEPYSCCSKMVLYKDIWLEVFLSPKDIEIGFNRWKLYDVFPPSIILIFLCFAFWAFSAFFNILMYVEESSSKFASMFFYSSFEVFSETVWFKVLWFRGLIEIFRVSHVVLMKSPNFIYLRTKLTTSISFWN